MSSDRFTVVGPARWKRSLHTSLAVATERAHDCSEKFPNAVCRVEAGLPGLQKVVAECNRGECYRTHGLGRRRRSRKK